nr:PREDICTED: uncharacterized protein LOC109041072 [Bemisia tabaci]
MDSLALLDGAGAEAGRSTVEEVIYSTTEGINILANYRNHGALSEIHRARLVGMVIDHELSEHPDTRIHQNRFVQLAQEIVALFPNEKQDTYYKPSHYISPKKTLPPRGKLFEKYANRRRDFRASGLIASRRGRGRYNIHM